MCIAIEYAGQRISWSNEEVRLPVLRRDGGIEWIPWGLPYPQKHEAKIPAGGWARLESIKDGKWKKYGIRPVKIPARRFAERDASGNEHWFEMGEGTYIQGALVRLANRHQIATMGEWKFHVYVVTQPPTPDVAAIHDRMPRVVVES